MTLLSIWYRQNANDLYAIADSRLVTSNGGVLSDHAPKFTTAHVDCYSIENIKSPERPASRSTIGIGYTGSSSVAFATIATLQSFLSSLCLGASGLPPNLADIAFFARHLLEENFKSFGALWVNEAKCDLILFGSMTGVDDLKAFHLSTTIETTRVLVTMLELPLVKDRACFSFGSGSKYFMEQLRMNMESTRNFHPFNLLERIIAASERSDIGGAIQVAIASSIGVILPHVIKPRLDLGEFNSDVTFLGRSMSDLPQIGECTVGRVAVGPDLSTLTKMRKDAGY
jgi:hypothetical protein